MEQGYSKRTEISEKELRKIKKGLEYDINRGYNPQAVKIIMFPVPNPKLTNENLKKYINKKYL